VNFRLFLQQSHSEDLLMMNNFYVGKDASIVAGAANFAARIITAPTTLGLNQTEAESFSDVNDALQAAYQLSTEPITRTSVTVQATRTAIENMRAQAIRLSRIVYATPTVTDAQLVSLGLKPRPTYTSPNLPKNPPTVIVLSVQARLVNIRVQDVEWAGRGMPPNADSANIYSFVGPEAPTDPRQYHFEGATKRAKAQILFPDSVASGATVWLSASWVSGRGEIGFGSTPISFTLQGGAIPASAV
jgi:hypothetical protein